MAHLSRQERRRALGGLPVPDVAYSMSFNWNQERCVVIAAGGSLNSWSLNRRYRLSRTGETPWPWSRSSARPGGSLAAFALCKGDARVLP
jgi:hypothetical protein